MTPERKEATRTTTYFYFSCLHLDHRHANYSAACKCIEKSHKPKINMVKWDESKYLKVIEMRDFEGLSYRQIGVNFGGTSAERIRQIYMRALRIMSKPKNRLGDMYYKKRI